MSEVKVSRAVLSAAMALLAASLLWPAGSAARDGAQTRNRVVMLGLKRPEKALSRAARLVSAPGSPSYARFLGRGELWRRFGAPVGVRHRTLRYLRRARGVGRARIGPTGAVAIAVMSGAASRRLFCARGERPPRSGLCIPPALRGDVRQIVAGQLYAPRAQAHASIAASTGTPSGCKGALESGAFTPNQISAAYGADRLAAAGLSGRGVRVATMSSALIPIGPLRAWARCFGQPALRFGQATMPGAGLDTGTAPEETYLDAEALAAIAPRLERITAIAVPLDLSFRSSFALFMLGALDPARQGGRLPDLLSISDGVCESQVSRAERAIGQHMLRAAAVLGITVLAASGDLGFLGCQESAKGASWPAGSIYVTGVGGTDLALDPDNRIASQTVWSTFATEPASGTGSGGGPSSVWTRPGWQVAPGIGPALQAGEPTRLTPDLAAMGSFSPGLAVYGGYGGWMAPGGGTSAATPLSAGILALVEERERGAGRPPLGAVNPLLYALAAGPDHDAVFRDVTEGTSSPRPDTAFGRSPAGGAAQPGYDLATGLGSLRAEGFAETIAAVRGGAR